MHSEPAASTCEKGNAAVVSSSPPPTSPSLVPAIIMHKNEPENSQKRLRERFDEALSRVKKGLIKRELSNEDKLKLYGLFKTALKGKASGNRPSAWNPIARAKFDAWHKYSVDKGMSKLEIPSSLEAENQQKI